MSWFSEGNTQTHMMEFNSNFSLMSLNSLKTNKQTSVTSVNFLHLWVLVLVLVLNLI